ncbi:uncharacterized protein BXZ73DRAFT_80484 [Epithele typhae]|uniref:uncharacterized protein n=1 Tax=Epithele typhae TaxID=378194 RepID=UPI002007E455|nr:uncharacterized protein BXZ73DRAFT_80484 [Epithele typhae]KAH9918702.1 hypothetical protein BXZ73DRAFT_80484 [Epithele typhae]
MTCKGAYAFAYPRFLSDVTLGDHDPSEDDGPRRLKQFCEHMLRNPELFKHLRALRLRGGSFACESNAGPRGGWDANYSAADSLTDLLFKAVNLRVLQIRDAEPVFQSHPLVYEAIASLPYLKELSLYYIVAPASQALGVRCMLESVVDRHIWLNVHTLDIGGRIAKISELAHVFPNLRRLTFFLEFSIKPETGPVVCWPELDYLETSAPLPSFPSPARRLQLQYSIGSKTGSRNDLKTLPLLEKTNPVVLSCTISQAVTPEMVERMSVAVPSVRYSEVVINDGSSGHTSLSYSDFDKWLDRHLGIIGKAKPEGLCIGYSGSGGHEEQFTAAASKTASRVPTLKYVAVGLHHEREGMYSFNSLWFTIESREDPEAPVLKRVPAADCESLRERLLNLPRATLSA